MAYSVKFKDVFSGVVLAGAILMMQFVGELDWTQGCIPLVLSFEKGSTRVWRGQSFNFVA